MSKGPRWVPELILFPLLGLAYLAELSASYAAGTAHNSDKSVAGTHDEWVRSISQLAEENG